jgi:ribonuclease BN (tRNA processing enzyme)
MSATVTFVGSGDAFGSGGRFNTCILVDVAGLRVALDFGASSLIALKSLDIDHNTIDAIVCTHIHGDHCGGIPFLMLDAMLGAKRARPLLVAGPIGIHAGVRAMQLALFPGMERMTPKFAVDFVELATERKHEVAGMRIITYPAVHTPETHPTSVRIEAGGKIIAYTGDSEWTRHMPELARGADLLIAECYFHRKPVRFHLNYPTLAEHRHELNARKIVLTHMGPEMLAAQNEVPELCAYDGMVIEI